MPDDAAPAWSDLHDLALVYLALLHHPGALERPARPHDAARECLARFYPDVDDAHLRRVLREALVMYVSVGGGAMLDVSVASLGRALPRPHRAAVLDDLADLAETHGALLSDRMAFLQDLAYHWDLEG